MCRSVQDWAPLNYQTEFLAVNFIIQHPEHVYDLTILLYTCTTQNFFYMSCQFVVSISEETILTWCASEWVTQGFQQLSRKKQIFRCHYWIYREDNHINSWKFCLNLPEFDSQQLLCTDNLQENLSLESDLATSTQAAHGMSLIPNSLIHCLHKCTRKSNQSMCRKWTARHIRCLNTKYII